MVDKTRESKLIGRPKELHEETERLTFHLEKSVAEAIRGYVTKECKISAILRDAATEYLDKLRQEESINKLKGGPWEPFLKLHEDAKNATEMLGSPVELFPRIAGISRELLKLVEQNYSSHPQEPNTENRQTLREYFDLVSEQMKQSYSVTLDVYDRLLGFMAWHHSWVERFNRFKDSADRTLEKAKALKIRDIPIPEIIAKEDTTKRRK